MVDENIQGIDQNELNEIIGGIVVEWACLGNNQPSPELHWFNTAIPFVPDMHFRTAMIPLCQSFLAWRLEQGSQIELDDTLESKQLYQHVTGFHYCLLAYSQAPLECLKIFVQVLDQMSNEEITNAPDMHELLDWLVATYTCIKEIHRQGYKATGGRC